MNTLMRHFTMFLTALLLISGCSGKQQERPKTEIVVSAAVSLKESLNDIKKQYEKTYPHNRVTFNFGSSGTLRNQIEQGAPVDLFISASKSNMDDLLEQKLIDHEHVTSLLSNALVVIVPKASSFKLDNLNDLADPGFARIALGQPDTVPAGIYGKESLLSYELWETLETKMIFAKDVRQALILVESGNVDAGFVYKTDALISDKAKIAYTIDHASHSPIVYPAGIVQTSKHPKQALRFYEFLNGKKAKTIFQSHGFGVR